ncbi:NAD(P)-dependent oxidoreductase [Amycolatopsis pithecellobii]|uniref:NAD-binding protein n=1 Tax=Amycolatopsis pithecellobii TaxID=664692 RepID=A0A6N7ZB53_9PSEU|nr:NAD(P)-dependent oxidoreductase [Amycolatopsis pithecellobii]MTD58939.1 NAD-binding protein [Amycolatopsis pithecellobii]
MPENASSDYSQLRIGVVGLGTIGSGVIKSLDRSGVTATGYDIDQGKAGRLPCAGAASAAEVASASDVVLISVVNGDQARDVLFGPKGIAAGARPNLIVALLSTVSLETLLELSEDAAKAGIRLLDSPVTAGQHAATNGLVVMLGGDEATAEEALPALRAFAKAAIYCGPLGAGMAAKLVRQIIVAGSWKVMYDAACFARAVGVEYGRVKEIVQAADPDGETVLGLMGLRGDSLAELPAPKQQELRKYYDLMVKDITAARELGEAHDFRLPMVDELITDPGPAMYGVTNGVEHHG